MCRIKVSPAKTQLLNSLHRVTFEVKECNNGCLDNEPDFDPNLSDLWNDDKDEPKYSQWKGFGKNSNAQAPVFEWGEWVEFKDDKESRVLRDLLEARGELEVEDWVKRLKIQGKHFVRFDLLPGDKQEKWRRENVDGINSARRL